MPGLTQKDIDILSKYSSNGDRVHYFNYIASLKGNDGYGALALGVVRNNNQPGAVANHFSASFAEEAGVPMSSARWEAFGQDLVRQDFALRMIHFNRSDFDKALNLPVADVEASHDVAFGNIGLSGRAWTPKDPLVVARTQGGEERAEQLWKIMLDNDNRGLDRFLGTIDNLIGLKWISTDWGSRLLGAYTSAMIDPNDYTNPNYVNGYDYNTSNGRWFLETAIGRSYLDNDSDMVRSLDEERGIRLERVNRERVPEDNSPNIPYRWMIGDNGGAPGTGVEVAGRPIPTVTANAGFGTVDQRTGAIRDTAIPMASRLQRWRESHPSIEAPTMGLG